MFGCNFAFGPDFDPIMLFGGRDGPKNAGRLGCPRYKKSSDRK